jgi:hypothetical protein
MKTLLATAAVLMTIVSANAAQLSPELAAGLASFRAHGRAASALACTGEQSGTADRQRWLRCMDTETEALDVLISKMERSAQPGPDGKALRSIIGRCIDKTLNRGKSIAMTVDCIQEENQ